MKSALRYIGNKQRLTSFILPCIPNHETYVEVFGGSAAILTNKPRSWTEVYNDANKDLVTFFRVVRDRGDELRVWLMNTPHSRAAFQRIADRFFAGGRPDSEVVHAGWVFYILQNNYGAALHDQNGFERPQTSARKRSRARMHCNKVHGLEEITERLRGVTLECADWREMFQRYDDRETFFYVDPPYVGSESLVGGTEDFDHAALADTLQDLDGKWLLSYGHCPEWADDFDVRQQDRGNTSGDNSITETLIANYDLDAAQFTDVAQTGINDFKIEP